MWLPTRLHILNTSSSDNASSTSWSTTTIEAANAAEATASIPSFPALSLHSRRSHLLHHVNLRKTPAGCPEVWAWLRLQLLRFKGISKVTSKVTSKERRFERGSVSASEKWRGRTRPRRGRKMTSAQSNIEPPDAVGMLSESERGKCTSCAKMSFDGSRCTSTSSRLPSTNTCSSSHAVLMMAKANARRQSERMRWEAFF